MLTGRSDAPIGFNPSAPKPTDHPSLAAIAGAVTRPRNNLPPAIVQAVALHHAEHPAPGLPTLIFTANLMTRHPDGALLLAEASEVHAAAARDAAESCGLTREAWSELAGGPQGGSRS